MNTRCCALASTNLRHGRVLLMVLVGVLVYAANTIAEQRIISVVARPDLVVTGVPTMVSVTAAVAADAALIRNSLTLVQVQAGGANGPVVARLIDDGVNAAGENVFIAQFEVNEPAPGILRFRVSAAYRGTLRRTLSDVVTVQVAEQPFSTPPDPAKVVRDSGEMYPYNELLVGFQTDTPRSTVEVVAASVGGTIAGYSPSTGVYQFSLPALSPADLTAIQGRLSVDPRVSRVMFNFLLALSYVPNDSSSNFSSYPGRQHAYLTENIPAAWEYLDSLSPPPTYSAVRVGIIDSGIDAQHPEFEGVPLGNTPADARTDLEHNGHGTSVAGIIGANNVSATGPLTTDAEKVQMNGVLSGLPSASSGSGSRIPYSLEVRRGLGSATRSCDWWTLCNATHITAMASVAAIDDLATRSVHVVNMSIGSMRGDRLTANQRNFYDSVQIPYLPEGHFWDVTALYEAAFNRHQNMLFVVSAGNDNINVEWDAPANLGGRLPNVLAVGAVAPVSSVEAVAGTTRSIWGRCSDLPVPCAPADEILQASNYGSGVLLSASGSGIYAPTVYRWPSAAARSPTDERNWREDFGGTSGAAPLVTGTAALLFSLQPSLTPKQLRDILVATGTTLVEPGQPVGKVVDAVRAVRYGAALITGIVRDRGTGAPIPNAGVFFYGSGVGTTTTDGNGRYTLTGNQIRSFGGALSGNLYVGASGYFEAPPVSISDLGAQPSLPVVRDITLLSGGVVVRGVVRNASTGAPIAGATVSFSRSPMSLFRGGAGTESVQTAGDGSYAIDASYFNESQSGPGANGFSISLMVNANGFLGANGGGNIPSWPAIWDFSLTPY